MKKTNKIIVASLLVIMLLLGIGYAAIQNITLNITGTATADPTQSAFKVMFSGEPTVSDSEHVTASVTDDTNATINVFGLTTEGDTVTATYTVQNASTDLSADLSVATTNSNTDYFTLKSQLAKTSLVAGEATTLTVTVVLTQTPVSESVNSTIGVQLTAMPVQPGEEGTSEGVNDYSQTPEMVKITADDIAISPSTYYGQVVTNYETTAGDPDVNWKIFYADADEDKIYLIASDYIAYDYIPTTSSGLAVYQPDENYKCGVIMKNVTADYSGAADVVNTFDSNTLQKWHKWINLNQTATYENVKAVAYLVDTNIWSIYKDSTYADYAIGCPTIELFAERYNDLHPSDKFEYLFDYSEFTWNNKNYTTAYGYAWHLESDGDNYFLQYKFDTGLSVENENNAMGMWMASPSAMSDSIRIMGINCTALGGTGIGYIHDASTQNFLGLCPVISLKSGVSITKNYSGGYDLVLD